MVSQEDDLSLSSQRGDELILSKRTVLQQIASVYDPLGLFSPVTLRGKNISTRSMESEDFLG